MAKTTITKSLRVSDWSYPEGMEEPNPVRYLVTDSHDLVILKNAYVRQIGKPSKLFVDIEGSGPRRIDVSYLSDLNTWVGHNTLFPYKSGFGLINHNKPELHLWSDLQAQPVVVEIENRATDIKVLDNCMRFASYDSVHDSFTIGIATKGSPVEYAKWWATLDIEGGKAYWRQAHALNLKDYPQTYSHYLGPVLEWLNISDLMVHDGKKYLVTPGGQRTVGKTGREFEFYILGIYNQDNQLEKTIELDFGRGRFSTDKKYFLVKPKTKKRLLIYDLQKQALEYNISLKPETNLGSLSRDSQVVADLRGDLLYLSDLRTINICKLMK